MKLHRNAKTTPTSRLELVRRTVDDGWRYQAVADGYGVSVRDGGQMGPAVPAARSGPAWRTGHPGPSRRRTSPRQSG